jgi:hypothetical protein
LKQQILVILRKSDMTPRPESWMSDCLPAGTGGLGDFFLREIVLPGSHDSGMSFCQNQSSLATEAHVVTQLITIAKQLEMGIRVFDIRPCIRKGELLTAHVQNFDSPLNA